MNGNAPTFFLPFPFQPDKPKERQTEQVPKRVQVAMGVLDYATEKTQSRIAVSGVGMEEYDGQELDVEEVKMFRTACEVMTQYLTGKLKMTDAEQEERKVWLGLQKHGEKTLMRCPQCGGARAVMNRRCNLCRGQGGIMVEPANLDGADNDQS